MLGQCREEFLLIRDVRATRSRRGLRMISGKGLRLGGGKVDTPEDRERLALGQANYYPLCETRPQVLQAILCRGPKCENAKRTGNAGGDGAVHNLKRGDLQRRVDLVIDDGG